MNINQLNAFAALDNVKPLILRFTTNHREKMTNLPILEVSKPQCDPATGDLKGPVYPIVYEQNQILQVKCYGDDKEIHLEPTDVLTFATLLNRLYGLKDERFSNLSYRVEVGSESFSSKGSNWNPDPKDDRIWHSIDDEIELTFWLLSRMYRGRANRPVLRAQLSADSLKPKFDIRGVAVEMANPIITTNVAPATEALENAELHAFMRVAYQLELLRGYLGYEGK